MGRGIGCSAERALWDCDRVGERCQCVEYAQRVERGWVGVKGEVMNCDGWGSGFGSDGLGGRDFGMNFLWSQYWRGDGMTNEETSNGNGNRNQQQYEFPLGPTAERQMLVDL